MNQFTYTKTGRRFLNRISKHGTITTRRECLTSYEITGLFVFLRTMIPRTTNWKLKKNDYTQLKKHGLDAIFIEPDEEGRFVQNPRYTQRRLKLRFFLRRSPGVPYPHTWLKAQFLAMRSIHHAGVRFSRSGQVNSYASMPWPQKTKIEHKTVGFQTKPRASRQKCLTG